MSYNYMPLKARLAALPLRKRVCIVIMCVLLIRIGSLVPLPFVDHSYMKSIMETAGLGFLNALMGSSLSRMSFFALSIGPYITASIIMQLMTISIPSLERLQREGKAGQEKFKRLTQMLGITLAAIQSAGLAIGLGRQGLLVPYNIFTIIGASVIWTLGAAAMIGIASFITNLGIGDGTSIILAANILSTLPSDVGTLKTVLVDGHSPLSTAVRIAVLLAAGVAAVCACVVLNTTDKRLPIRQSRKMVGHADSYFPIPLCTCSVMPVIFAGTITSLPALISRFVPKLQEGWFGHIARGLSPSEWFDINAPWYTIGAVLYVLLTVMFTSFYLDIGFNASEIAESFKKGGITIPGIRPGVPTADYIQRTSFRTAHLGNAFLIGLIMLMHIACNLTGVGSLGIAGTSIVIVVSVLLAEKKALGSAMAAERPRAVITGMNDRKKRIKSGDDRKKKVAML